MIIETERLILRPIIESDASDIFEYSKSPNVGPIAGWRPHESLDHTKEIMKAIFLNQETVFGMELKSSRKIFGSIGFMADPKRENDNARMAGYAIGEEYWGRGYTTEAMQALICYGFEELKLELISVYCYSFNARSKRVIEKCGFEHEGTLRLAERRYDGQVFDLECFSLMRNK